MHVINKGCLLVRNFPLFLVESKNIIGWALTLLSQSGDRESPCPISIVCVATHINVGTSAAVVLVDDDCRQSFPLRLLMNPVHCGSIDIVSQHERFSVVFIVSIVFLPSSDVKHTTTCEDYTFTGKVVWLSQNVPSSLR